MRALLTCAKPLLMRICWIAVSVVLCHGQQKGRIINMKNLKAIIWIAAAVLALAAAITALIVFWSQVVIFVEDIIDRFKNKCYCSSCDSDEYSDYADM